jgi:hypothetical protein
LGFALARTHAKMSTAALDRAIADMEASRKAFEAAAVRVSSELEALAERVTAANAKLSGERENVARAVAKRRRRSGGGAEAGRAACAVAQCDDVNVGANSDAQAERRFKDTVEEWKSADSNLPLNSRRRRFCPCAAGWAPAGLRLLLTTTVELRALR